MGEAGEGKGAQGAPEGWTRSDQPSNLFRRFEFGTYGETRKFLDQLSGLTKETGYYPDISFGRTYANVTVHARDGKALGAEDTAFAERANALAGNPTAGN